MTYEDGWEAPPCLDRCPDCRAYLSPGRETNECDECGTFWCESCGDGFEQDEMADDGRFCKECATPNQHDDGCGSLMADSAGHCDCNLSPDAFINRIKNTQRPA